MRIRASNKLHRLLKDRAHSAVCHRGFSLIEMIGVITVLALLALALTPILIKQFDRIAGEKEAATLKSLAQALRQGITTQKFIPNESGWSTMTASNSGLSDTLVRINDRKVARVFLIDPNFQIGHDLGSIGPPPYNQPATPP